MKSNRMRIFSYAKGRSSARWASEVDLENMPPPEPIQKPDPEKIVEDILVATLKRLQKGGNSEIAAAAEHYLEVLRPVP